MLYCKYAGALVTSVACLSAAGCGGSGMPTTKVQGAVTFEGGPPPKPGDISFSLVEGTGAAGLPYRPGSGSFGTDGRFEVTSFEKGDGLLPGTYEVRITCLSAPPSQGPLAKLSYVPLDWEAENLVITGDESAITVDYDVPLNKNVRQ